MNKIYYLSTCDTCQRILKELHLEFSKDFEFQDVKKQAISEADLSFLRDEVGSYELIFNKRSKLYRERNLNEQNLTEEDYKQLILEHYTFLKRPIIVIKDRVITGNATKIIKEVRKYLEN